MDEIGGLVNRSDCIYGGGCLSSLVCIEMYRA